jgi:hypothetical protein
MKRQQLAHRAVCKFTQINTIQYVPLVPTRRHIASHLHSCVNKARSCTEHDLAIRATKRSTASMAKVAALVTILLGVVVSAAMTSPSARGARTLGEEESVEQGYITSLEALSPAPAPAAAKGCSVVEAPALVAADAFDDYDNDHKVPINWPEAIGHDGKGSVFGP